MATPSLLIPARGLLRGWKRLAATSIDLVGSVLMRPKTHAPFDPAQVHDILVLRLDHIGDVVMTTAFLEALHAALPHAGIDVLTKPLCAPLLEHHPAVRTIHAHAAPWTSRASDPSTGSASLSNLPQYDLVVSPRGDLRENRLAHQMTRAWSVGFAVRGGGFYLTHTAPFDASLHQTLRETSLLKELQLPIASDAQPRLYLTDHELQNAAEQLRSVGLSLETPFTIINPGAASPSKQWPINRFAHVANTLQQEGFPVGITAGPGEEELCNAIQTHAPNAIRIPVLPLRAMTALFAHAATVLCNDSGPMHIAAAVSTPVVALFGATCEQVTGPVGKHHLCLTPRMEHRPVWFPGTPPPPEAICHRALESISANTVSDATLSILKPLA